MTFPTWPDGTANALEEEMLQTWQSEKLFEQTREATRGSEPFVFYEGPPTANGRPGIHHVFSRTIKDLICRFQTMQGRDVTRIAGWDTHGLPVEIEVEKQLGLRGKRDIERYGVAEFNALCRESVFKYQSEWELLSDRIGYWLDYEHPYITCTNEYVESVWWILSRLHQRNLLYRGHRVLPYCPRCGTVLSSHELALGYEDVTTNSIYVTFPLADDPSRQLLVWTTTPWTLLANVAVAVHPDLEYGEYEVDGTRYILATTRADLPVSNAKGAGSFADVGPVRTFSGRDLVGLKYSRPLEVVLLPEDQLSREVIGAEFVSAGDGSGLVHIAPAFGADDHAAGREHGLAMVRPVAADGTVTDTEWPAIEGQLVTAKTTNDTIIQRLKEDGRWHLTEPHKHTYPHCWRCRSPLIYYARDSWFVRTTAVKEQMLQHNQAVGWHPPEVGSGRFGEWLENNVDWALSRDRYWGTPLPVWVCEDDPDHVKVIGSYQELVESWGRPLAEDFDPHKPFIDDYQWSCECGGTMRRTPEVIDTWFDSGSMPFAQWHYPFENTEEFEKHFPADFICEGVDQTRGWFYSLLAIATTAFDSSSYRNVIVNEMVLDPAGQKMSKSRGNVVDPRQVIERFGADTVRTYLLASSQVWLPKRFDERVIPEVAGGFFDTLKNTYRFLALYAGEWTPGGDVGDPLLVDRWLESRLNATIVRVNEAWSGYDVTAGIRAIMEFVVDDLSNWYVRINRNRFWAPDSAADPVALDTLFRALVAVSRMLAPAAPFVGDWLHRALVGTSVHLARFPVAYTERDEPLELAMDAARRVASLARAGREEANLKVRQPVARLQVAVPREVPREAFRTLFPLIQHEVNVKVVELVDSDTDLVRLRAKPNFRSLGKRFGKRTPVVAQAATGLAPEQLRVLEGGGTATLEVDGEAIEYLAEDVTVEREVTSDWVVQSDGPFVAALDPELTEDLRREGMARELVHRVQRLRKEAGYDYTTRITIALDGAEEVLAAVGAHAEFVAGETLARRLDVGERAAAPDVEADVAIDGTTVTVGIRRFE
jgi:isoleucyl-tRNA synthetase